MSINRQERGTASGRDRRMFASIQSALGGNSGPSPYKGPRTRAQARAEEELEKLDDVEQVIARIIDLSIRGDSSAMQIKKSIISCNYLEQMSETEWEKLSKALFDSALNHNETDFVVDIFGSLLVHQTFCQVICREIAQRSAEYIMNGKKDDSIPHFLGSILCGNWPRGATRAAESSNPILYTVLSIVRGWLIVLNDSEKEPRILTSLSNNMKRDFEELEHGEDTDDEDEEPLEETQEQEDQEGATQEVVGQCAKAIASMCSSVQRSLWMKWPSLCDEIYAAIKPSITHSKVLTGDTKAELLSTLILLHKWTNSKVSNTKTSHTQTVAHQS